MMVDIAKTDIEKKLQHAMEGYRSLPGRSLSFTFPERELAYEEVIARFQQGLDLFTEVRRTRAEYEAAVEKHRQALPGMKLFHAESLKVARKHFGSDPKMMATFGVRCLGHSKRRHGREECQGGEEVVTTVVEEVTIECEEAPCEGHARISGEGQRRRRCKPRKVAGSKEKQRCRAQKR